VFADSPDDLVTLQWHGDTFDLPLGAVRLAGSPAYPNQAFRVERAYGLQFHLEVSGEMAREWAEVPEYVTSLERTLGSVSAPAFLAAIEERADEMRRTGRSLFERWLERVVATSVA
jgi:GMP synthase-like glutamine amidotransferase